MEFFNSAFFSEDINWETSLIRIIISFIAGAVVGLEREFHSQPAGLRSHILISIGSTLVMLISIFVSQDMLIKGDPGRIAAQVVSGIGFLGAGAILKLGADIKGLTTAASIWAMAVVGLAIGAGMFGISMISVIVIIFDLTGMNIFERKFFSDRTLRRVEIIVKKRQTELQKIAGIFKQHDIQINSTGFERNVHDATDRFIFIVAVSRELNVQKLADDLEQENGTVSVIVDILN